MARWTYLVADLRTNVILGELPLTNVKWSKVLNGTGQLQADLKLGDQTVPVTNPRDLTTPARRALYALRDDRPMWGGIIWARDYSSADQVLSIAAADWWSYFDHRKVLEVLTLPAAPTYVAGLAVLYNQQDQNDIARGLVELAQSHTGGDIGIEVDDQLSAVLRDRTYPGFDLQYTGQALRDITALLDGIDIVFDVGPADSNGRPTRIMRTGGPQITQPGADWVWNLGGNMLEFTWSSGGGVMATRAFAQGSGIDTGTQIAVAENTDRYTTGWPLLETDDIFATVSEFTTLQNHADALLDDLDLPLVTVALKVRADFPPMLGEFSVGDHGIASVPADLDPFLPDGIELPVRVLAMTVEVDDQGQETVTLPCASQEEVT